MKTDSFHDAGDYRPDPRLTDAYEEACRQDDDVLESVCPSFVDLGREDVRYCDETLLGQGGLKDVFRAFDRRTRRWVALARLREDRGLQYYDLFVREAWLVASLSHPNIIKVHDAGVDADGRPFFTMDLKGDANLAGLIKESPFDALNDLLDVFQKVCDAVAYAHSREVIHLDLKPENIQCDRFGEVMVCDWGLGKALGCADDEAGGPPLRSIENMTMMGQIKGSLGYMAPEQVLPGQEKDQRTDIYALGCILHTLLCGEPPFTGSAEQVLDDTASADVAPLQARYPERVIPESLEAVVLKATSRTPADRYESVESLRQEIHKFLSGFSTEAEQSGFFKEARLFLRRNRKSSIVALGSLVVLTVLSVLFVQRLGQQQMATEEERGRANRLLAEVNVISSDYEELFEQSTVSRKELAEQLSIAANSVKNLGIFHQPKNTVKEARQLVDMALQLDPDCSSARWQRFILNCLTLNYKAALADSPQARSAVRGQPWLANAFPHYNFDEKSRPSTEQLTALFKKAQENDPARLTGYLERVFIYHDSTSKDRSGRSRELEALLACFNGGPEHFTMSYDDRAASLKVWSDRELFRLHGKRAGCLLRFIPVRSLKISASGGFNLKEIGRLPVETLNLSECAAVRLDKPVSLPQLKTLIVRRGQIVPEELRLRIKTNERFEIIELR